MNKEEILNWAKRYDKDHPVWTQTEKELGDKFRKTKEVTKDDLKKVVEWKFMDLPTWKEDRLKDVDKIDDDEIRRRSREVFGKAENDSDRVNKLKFSGVGTAIVSVILTFYNPKEYGVFDRHVWQGLFGEQPQDFFTKEFYANTENYLMVLKRLRDEAEEYNLDVRTVEKAYFKKHKSKPKKRY